MRIQSRVHKPDRALPSRKPLLIDSRKDSGESWRAGGCASDADSSPVTVNYHVVANGGEVGVPATSAIVDAAICVAGGGVVGAGVGGVGGCVLG
jgi:hypothetical protein